MADRENRDGVAILVAVEAGGSGAVLVEVMIAEDTLALIDRYAVDHGFDRSGFLAHAARRAMEEA